MNTKRLFFGLLAVAFLAMTAVSTTAVDFEDDQTVSIEKKKIRKL
ncbi:hypothetical protein [Flagellimonas meishanensis]|nr:hypothetical protein [[Muricauda] meishanensis]